MSLRKSAASGAAWNIALNLLARVAGLVGTVVITRHLAPSVMGEVTTATIVAFTGNWLSAWGFNRYLVVRGHLGIEHVFHVTVLHLGLGTLALLTVLALGTPLAGWLNTPHLTEYLPGMVLAVWLRRLASVPDKQLQREMRFRTIALATASGELAYVVLAVLLVSFTSLGGMGIVIANIVQSALMAGIEIGATGWRSWLTPVRLQWQRLREILQFGAPLAVEAIMNESSRYWDKLVFVRLFGPAPTALYSLGYNLCDLPATYVGEEVATVLFPTLVKVEPAQRNAFFCEAFGLLGLVVLPMAAGIACVAHELVATVMSPEWRGLESYMVVLSAVALFRPMNSVICSLLLATERNRTVAFFEALKVLMLLGGMWLLGQLGQLPAAAAVGLALFAQTSGLLVVMTRRGFPIGTLLHELRGPVLATAVMSAAVLLVHRSLAQWLHWPDAAKLFLEIGTGVVSYIAAAWLLAPAASRRMLKIAQRR